MSIFKMIPFGVIIFLVLGLMMIGIATPTESAAVGAIAGLIFAAFLRKLTLKMMRDALLTTVNVTAMILFVIAGSKAFSQILAISGAMRGIVDTVTGLSLSPFILLIVMQGIPFVLGFFLDNISIMMMTIPFYVPLVEFAKFDPIWFWCLYLVNMTIGLISPPFGLVLFTLKASVPSASLKDVYDASLPFVLMVLLGMIFMIMFPQVATVVPRLFSHS